MNTPQFSFGNRSNRRTLLLLLIAGTAVFTAIFFAGHYMPQTATDGQLVQADSTGRVPLPDDTVSHREYYAVPTTQPERFPFDPNTADSTQLLRLGLQEWQVRNIYKYRARGGVYRRKEDFARVYGLTVKQYRELEPYIKISSDYLPATTLVEDRPFGRDSVGYPEKIADTVRIVLNLADSLQLRSVPGIGLHFSREILRYGEWLGGYVSVDQLDEIYEFPKEAKRYFIISDPQTRRMNINRLSLNDLKKHPYINFRQARAITDYRRRHGPIDDINDLRLLPDFTDDDIERLRPYIKYN